FHQRRRRDDPLRDRSPDGGDPGVDEAVADAKARRRVGSSSPRLRATRAYGTTEGFGSIFTIQTPLYMSLTQAAPSFTTTPHVMAAFCTRPSMSAVFRWPISRPWARRSPRSSPEMSKVRKPPLYAPMYSVSPATH